GAGVVYLDVNATVQDADSSDFNGGNLSIVNTSLAEDDLTISSTGTVRQNGSDVEYDASGNFTGGEVVIGTISSTGLGGVDLVIDFNAACTPAIAQELLRQIQYENTNATPDTTPRSITITLTDEASLTSADADVLLFAPASGGGGGGGSGGGGCAVSGYTGSMSAAWLLLLGLTSLLYIRKRHNQKADG
ncbi:MAG: hypothetical protein L3J82_03345, partial [Planctomycetes bacterium]|nr:hypothetical protein [Planctomycetota bacterium]